VGDKSTLAVAWGRSDEEKRKVRAKERESAWVTRFTEEKKKSYVEWENM
jgi:hypothetical protein